MFKHKSTYIFLVIILLVAWFVGRFVLPTKKDQTETKIEKTYKEIFNEEMPENYINEMVNEKSSTKKKKTNYKGWTESEIIELKNSLKIDYTIINSCENEGINVDEFINCYIDKVVTMFEKKDVLIENPSEFVANQLAKFGLKCNNELKDKSTTK